MLSLPKYQCHKTVEAGVITQIDRSNGTLLVDGGATGGKVDVGWNWIERHDPKIGGYFVRYEDGYTSFSPKEVFEKGYTLLGARLPLKD